MDSEVKMSELFPGNIGYPLWFSDEQVIAANKAIRSYDANQKTIKQQQEVIEECRTLLKKFRPFGFGCENDDNNDESWFEYNDGSEYLGEEVRRVMSLCETKE